MIVTLAPKPCLGASERGADAGDKVPGRCEGFLHAGGGGVEAGDGRQRGRALRHQRRCATARTRRHAAHRRTEVATAPHRAG